MPQEKAERQIAVNYVGRPVLKKDNTILAARAKPFDRAAALEICQRLSEGESLSRICESGHIPGRNVVMQWVRENPEFAQAYNIARREQGEAIFDRIIDRADTLDDVDDAQIASTQFRAWQWTATRLHPKKFAERSYANRKIQQSVSVTDNRPPLDMSALTPEMREQLKEALQAQVTSAEDAEPIDGEFKEVDDEDDDQADDEN